MIPTWVILAVILAFAAGVGGTFAVLLLLLWIVLPPCERRFGVASAASVGLACGSAVGWYLYQPPESKLGPAPAVLWGSVGVLVSTAVTGVLLWGVTAWKRYGGRGFDTGSTPAEDLEQQHVEVSQRFPPPPG